MVVDTTPAAMKAAFNTQMFGNVGLVIVKTLVYLIWIAVIAAIMYLIYLLIHHSHYMLLLLIYYI